MPVYTIAFEPRNPALKHDYAPLQKELEAQRCAPVLTNVWVGSFNNSASQVHDHFRKLVATDDRLMVAELVQHFAYSRIGKEGHAWLQNNPAGGLPQAAATKAKPPEPKPTPAKAAPATAPAKPAPKPAAKPKPTEPKPAPAKATPAAKAKPAAKKPAPRKAAK